MFSPLVLLALPPPSPPLFRSPAEPPLNARSHLPRRTFLPDSLASPLHRIILFFLHIVYYAVQVAEPRSGSPLSSVAVPEHQTDETCAVDHSYRSWRQQGPEEIAGFALIPGLLGRLRRTETRPRGISTPGGLRRRGDSNVRTCSARLPRGYINRAAAALSLGYFVHFRVLHFLLGRHPCATRLHRRGIERSTWVRGSVSPPARSTGSPSVHQRENRRTSCLRRSRWTTS